MLQSAAAHKGWFTPWLKSLSALSFLKRLAQPTSFWQTQPQLLAAVRATATTRHDPVRLKGKVLLWLMPSWQQAFEAWSASLLCLGQPETIQLQNVSLQVHQDSLAELQLKLSDKLSLNCRTTTMK